MLGPVDHPLVTVLDRRGAHSAVGFVVGHQVVTPGVRLGDSHREKRSGVVSELGKEKIALLRCASLDEELRHLPGLVKMGGEARIALAQLLQHQKVRQDADARAAVFLGQRRGPKPKLRAFFD